MSKQSMTVWTSFGQSVSFEEVWDVELSDAGWLKFRHRVDRDTTGTATFLLTQISGWSVEG